MMPRLLLVLVVHRFRLLAVDHNIPGHLLDMLLDVFVLVESGWRHINPMTPRHPIWWWVLGYKVGGLLHVQSVGPNSKEIHPSKLLDVF
jgi:hypothetical protein